MSQLHPRCEQLGQLARLGQVRQVTDWKGGLPEASWMFAGESATRYLSQRDFVGDSCCGGFVGQKRGGKSSN